MPAGSLVLFALIVGCEVGFWLVLLASLAARYVLRRDRLSRGLMLALPAIDLLLIAFTAIDLRAGTVATVAHGLAAVYVGFTIAFGSVAVRWADAQFAHRFAGGPVPAPMPGGWQGVRVEIGLWLRCIGAWLIAFTLIEGLIAAVGDRAITDPLRVWHRYGFGCVFFWFIFGPAWSLLFGWRRRP